MRDGHKLATGVICLLIVVYGALRDSVFGEMLDECINGGLEQSGIKITCKVERVEWVKKYEHWESEEN
ncbi:hypothetical protein [Pseudoalteromonas maricaloris]|uniref:hypothetical protein n=1 Tax=Pseudoalteromonas maricaloris TaxID=184924 RepID=UPI00057E00A1|nr:hypothetical protein [Pseudoalteromonas flavipulchra]KID38053.1 hypothetical protein QT15_04615 [Pseudoalteromonas flavipulchra NCIMB 2033 = ATCC BAA-314]MBD0782777.1 hypothetical protein [Pseudoalteromonas flavipulchra]MBE0372367.1 hypothetical protein [Pseudoalteromonas flavipulchra NCIMB 2033 = ATCC BAA-314]